MINTDLFEKFNDGKFILPNKEVYFKDIPWSKHPTFEGVELKHVITAKDTDGKFSFHLVRIAPNKKIGLHVHKEQLETHEVICGTGVCINDNFKLDYAPGIISIFHKNIEHQVLAGDSGLYLFAKFFPALC